MSLAGLSGQFIVAVIAVPIRLLNTTLRLESAKSRKTRVLIKQALSRDFLRLAPRPISSCRFLPVATEFLSVKAVRMVVLLRLPTSDAKPSLLVHIFAVVSWAIPASSVLQLEPAMRLQKT